MNPIGATNDRTFPLPPYFRAHFQGATVSPGTDDSKMPQAFSAPSAEPHKEARPLVASQCHLQRPRSPTGQRRSMGLPGAHCGARTALGLLTARVGAIGQGCKGG